MVKYFPRFLISMVKHAVKIEPIKYLGKYMPIYVQFFRVQKNQSICDKVAFLCFTYKMYG